MLVPPNSRCRNIIYNQKRPRILRTTHVWVLQVLYGAADAEGLGLRAYGSSWAQNCGPWATLSWGLTNEGFLKPGGTFMEVFTKKDYDRLGSILAFPYSGKLPNFILHAVCLWLGSPLA